MRYRPVEVGQGRLTDCYRKAEPGLQGSMARAVAVIALVGGCLDLTPPWKRATLPDAGSTAEGSGGFMPLETSGAGGGSALDASPDEALGGEGGSGGSSTWIGETSGAGPDTGGNIGVDGEIGPDASGTGGATATAGVAGSGETNGSGGTDSSGDAPTAGGATVTGGTNGTGGAPASGGAIGIGGTNGTGGVIATGGANGTGGVNGTGGAIATGGANGTGGAKGTGGATAPVTVSCPAAAPAGVTPAWCSCDQWGQWTNAAATYYNDVWGSGHGGQCIWVSGGQWGTAAKHPNTDGVKAYPHIAVSPGKAIAAINTFTSSFDVTVPSDGLWETAYVLLITSPSSTGITIMLWVNKSGSDLPASSTSSPAVSNVSTGGHTWDVYYGSHGNKDIISLVRTSNTNSGTVDIMAILNWLIANRGSFDSSWTFAELQFGFQIVSDGVVQSFVCNSLSISST